MSILGRLQDRLRERTSRAPALEEVKVDAPTLSPRLRASIQKRVNGRKSHQPQVVTVRDSGRVFYFRSDWARKEMARRRKANKAARIARRANR